jgi:hypothetical protein
MFTRSKVDDGARFLREVEESIDRNDLMTFSNEFGFKGPKNLPFERIVEVLDEHRFPSSDRFKYGWTIYECGAKTIATYSEWVRLFVSSIYLYTYKVEPFDGKYDGEFLFLLLEGAMHDDRSKFARLLLLFLEWMYDHVPSGAEYDDYYLLLTWVLLKIQLREAADPAFPSVVSILKNKNYSWDDIRLNTGGLDAQPEDWFALLERLPDVPDADQDVLVRIICGNDKV